MKGPCYLQPHNGTPPRLPSGLQECQQEQPVGCPTHTCLWDTQETFPMLYQVGSYIILLCLTVLLYLLSSRFYIQSAPGYLWKCVSHMATECSSRTRYIRASVDALCRDGTSEISRDPRTKRLQTRRESLAMPSKHTDNNF